MNVETSTPELEAFRKSVVEMLFAEGNHLCPSCEKSGSCELQALAYRYRDDGAALPLPVPEARASTRGTRRCSRTTTAASCASAASAASTTADGKPMFAFGSGATGWSSTSIRRPRATSATRWRSRPMDICPVGAILRKEKGFDVPDRPAARTITAPIGSESRRSHEREEPPWQKKIVATASLAGCFGCHMSFLDIDERILELIELVDFDKSPIDDIKTFTRACDIGLIEGGCCNDENVDTLIEFRKHCDDPGGGRRVRAHGRDPVACGTSIPLKECLDEAYLNGPTVAVQSGADHPERSRAPAHARPGLSLPRGREDRLLPAGLPAERGPDLGRARRRWSRARSSSCRTRTFKYD